MYLHGAPASRLLKIAQSGEPLCITVTLLDGLVLARSVFHSSMNYRSAVLFGYGRSVETPAEKAHALRVLTDHLARGRREEARPPTPKELEATSVVAVSIESASAKI
ncbi:MAG: pyridoxamine 5'-phosphate oxidase family protein, partial [Anaerolineae bacterium]|nr:pyridoxamine 5'-phosphate oxidase family protein [Anaerolineae bacterium]